MNLLLIFAVTAALLGIGMRTAITARADEVRYTFDDPGKGWSNPEFDAHGWKKAPDLSALAARWRETGEPALWIRLTQDMTWQQVNNSYFRVGQEKSVEISVNGKFLASVKKPAQEIKEFPVTAHMGWVWTFERDGTWNRDPGTFHNRPARAVWAPEISYFNGHYWLAYSVNHTTSKHSFGVGILRAEKPEGPWQEISPERPVSEGYDPSLFRDDDGKVYLLRNKSLIARLKDDLSGPAEPFRTIAPTNFPCVGFEGPCLFKYKGRYHLAAAESMLHADGKTSYDCVVASADHVYGPYGPRYVAIRYGGHNGFFQDKDGQLRATV